MTSKSRILLNIAYCFFFVVSSALIAAEPPESFIMTRRQMNYHGVERVQKIPVSRNDAPSFNSSYAIITAFSDSSIESWILPNIQTRRQVVKLFKIGIKKYAHEKITIREKEVMLPLGKKRRFFWVGDTAFDSLEMAKQAIDTALLAMQEELAKSEVTPEIDEVTQPEVEELEEEVVIEEPSEYPLNIDTFIKEDMWQPISAPEDTRFEYMNWSGITYSDDNESMSLYSEHRIVFEGINLPGEESLNPYIFILPKLTTNSEEWANVIEWGGGLEYRIFENFEFLEANKWMKWTQSLRLYIDYRNLQFLKDADPSVPNYDVRVGIDIWKRYNDMLHDEAPRGSIRELLWTEIYGDLSWRKTNFSGILGDEYKSIVLTSALRFGIKWPWITRDIPLTPYVLVDCSASENDFWWENRLRLGGGINVSPFHTNKFDKNPILKTMLFFTEYKYTVSYLKDDPADDPTEDANDGEWIVGVNFNINWY
ncbi:hypothetical protein ACFL1T_01625 [Chlamydiota bacterium]